MVHSLAVSAPVGRPQERRWAAGQGIVTDAPRRPDLVEVDAVGPALKAVQDFLLAPELTGRWADRQVAWRLVPALGVGGDFICFVDRGARGLGVAIGDVAGKGPSAALVAEVIKAALARAAAEDLDAAAMVGAVEARIGGRIAALGAFATMLYLELAPDGKSLAFVDCGHAHGIHVRAGGRPPEALQAGSKSGNLPLGLGSPEYRAERREVAPGELLFVATDGAYDARNPAGERLGDRVASGLLGVAGDVPVELLGAAADRRIRVHSAPGRPDDDYAFVVLRL